MKTMIEQTVRTEMGDRTILGGAIVGECYPIYVEEERISYNLEILEILATREVEIEEEEIDFSCFLG